MFSSFSHKEFINLLGMVAQACSPSYLGGEDWEHHGLRPAQANSSWDPPISKILRARWTEGVAQAVEHLLYKHPPVTHTTHKKGLYIFSHNTSTKIQTFLKKWPTCWENQTEDKKSWHCKKAKRSHDVEIKYELADVMSNQKAHISLGLKIWVFFAEVPLPALDLEQFPVPIPRKVALVPGCRFPT
jgi:hypothetical protein